MDLTKPLMNILHDQNLWDDVILLKRNQYLKWGEVLFEEINSSSPKLKEQVYFKIIPWEKSPKSLWDEYGGFTLGLQEYFLIDLIQKLFPGELLNIEGVIKNS